jgi:hypothetical protein
MRADAAARRLLDVLLGAPVQSVVSARTALGTSLQAAKPASLRCLISVSCAKPRVGAGGAASKSMRF